MELGGALNRDGVASVGGIASAALVTSLASPGIQHRGVHLFQRSVGDVNGNMLVGPSANVALTAIGTAGLQFARAMCRLTAGGLASLLFGSGLDIRSEPASLKLASRRIGLFFGTKGMTSAVVTGVLAQLSQNLPWRRQGVAASGR
jgi:hypothetical protein